MSGPGPGPGPGEAIHGTQRLEALADGVFAIVMTFLVFELSPPKDRPVADLPRLLIGLWPSLVAFVISVGLVGIYWSAHRAMFGFFVRTSHGLNWLNLLFLATVSLVPFSTRLVALYHDHPLALAVYGGNLVLIGLSLLAFWMHATIGRRLVDRGLPHSVVRYGISRCLVGMGGYALATALAFVHTSASLVVFATVPLLYILPPIQRIWLEHYGIYPRAD